MTFTFTFLIFYCNILQDYHFFISKFIWKCYVMSWSDVSFHVSSDPLNVFTILIESSSSFRLIWKKNQCIFRAIVKKNGKKFTAWTVQKRCQSNHTTHTIFMNFIDFVWTFWYHTFLVKGGSPFHIYQFNAMGRNLTSYPFGVR